MTYRNNISSQIEGIALGLQVPFQHPYPALLGGEMGEVLFLFYFARYSGSEHWQQIAMERLEAIFDQLEEMPYRSTFCNGLAGIFWGVEHLIEHFSLDTEIRDSLAEFDEYLGEEMVHQMAGYNYDFLHGALGIALYLLKRRPFNPAIEPYFSQTLDHLEHYAVEKDGLISWTSTFTAADDERTLNISLSHGMSGLLSVLTRMLQAGVEPARCRNLLEKAVPTVLSQEQSAEQYGSMFPPASINASEKVRQSRLAWCYGDLGIALMLYHAGKATANPLWIKKAMEIFTFNSTRRDLEKAMVRDAGLCHGAAGIAQIYQRMHLETGVLAFKETQDFWNEQTLRMAQVGKGIGGYLPVARLDPIPMSMTRNLLEGAAGIGISLIHADSELLPDWDAALLLH